MLYLDVVKSSLNLLGGAARTVVALGVVLTVMAFSSAHAQVVINEVMASNDKSVPNGADYPDWVELYNPSADFVNIGGYGLTDSLNISNAFKFKFSAQTQLAPFGYLIVWCDSLTNSPGIHANFSFSQNGETVRLYNPNTNVVDSVEFGPQITDLTVGRLPNGGANWTLTKPSLGTANTQAAPLGDPTKLRINEWMAVDLKPDGSANKDWFEIYNPETNAVSMSKFVFTDSNAFPATNGAMPDLYFIPAGGFYQFFADDKLDFQNANFKLSSTSGDQIYMYASNRVTVIDRVVFGPQTNKISQGRLPDGSTNIVYFRVNQPTPAESNFLPITNVVFSEFLTHTDEPLEDAVELLNIGATPADISGYWLSDSRDDAKKFRIPPNTIIPAGGRKVFYEYRPANGGTAACAVNGPGFNTSGLGEDRCFNLNSSRGDELYLYSADAAGNLTGFRRGLDFGPAENGVSFGRYVTSDGNTDYPAMSARSFGADNPGSLAQFRTGTGAANPYPLVGPVVINEVMYKPPTIYITNGTTITTNDNSIDEFIELHNITSTNVFLRHPQQTTNGWMLDDAVNFTFPPSAMIPANGYLLAVNFSPATNQDLLIAFKNLYSIPAGFTNIYGPYGGKLKNAGANVKLLKPDFVQEPPHPDAGIVPYVLVDRMEYKDAPPWPEPADGQGASLQRRHRAEYGNDSINWFAQGPTPGRTNNFVGTLRASNIVRGPGNQTAIHFSAIQGQSYTVEYKDSLTAVVWNTLVNVPPQTTNTTFVARDFGFSPTGNRFYRISTPTYP